LSERGLEQSGWSHGGATLCARALTKKKKSRSAARKQKQGRVTMVRLHRHTPSLSQRAVCHRCAPAYRAAALATGRKRARLAPAMLKKKNACPHETQAVTPLTSPVPESLYPSLAISLSVLGLSAAAGFFVYVFCSMLAREARPKRCDRKITHRSTLTASSLSTSPTPPAMLHLASTRNLILYTLYIYNHTGTINRLLKLQAHLTPVSRQRGERDCPG
jgi:hypothetical protein